MANERDEQQQNNRYNQHDSIDDYEYDDYEEDEMNYRYKEPADTTRTASRIQEETTYNVDDDQIENATATMFDSELFEEDDEEEEQEEDRRRRRMELSKSKKMEELEKEVAALRAMEDNIREATDHTFSQAQENLARAKTPKRKQTSPSSTTTSTTSTKSNRARTKRRPTTKGKTRKKSADRKKALEDDEIDEAAMGMGMQSQLVFYKSRAKTLEADLKDTKKKLSDITTKSKSLQTKVQSAEAEGSRMSTKVNTLEKAINRHKSAAKDAQHKVDTLTRELASLRKDLVEARKKHKETANQPSATDRERMTRLNKDNTALKDEIRMLKKLNHEQTEFERRAADKAKDELAMVQRQKADLIAAFKKQMKLIDVLKRQQVHLEAAQLLKFSEKEFSKALDFGSS